jgi:hypothetical protein
MVSVSDNEVPPPGAELTTVICAVPDWAMSEAGMSAVSWVVLTKLVVRGLPFHCSTEPGTKPDPCTPSTNAGPRAVTLELLNAEITGTGFVPEAERAMLLRNKITWPLFVTGTKSSTTKAKPSVPQRFKATAFGPYTAVDKKGTVPVNVKVFWS